MNNIPIGLADWFINRMEKIQLLNYTEGMEIPSNITEEWDRNIPLEGEDNPTYSAEPEYVEVAPLLKTQWGQGNGYNNYSPEFNCSGEFKKAPTGCVATAVAQVMKYYEFPNSYQWQIMPNRVFNSNSQEANEVSRLMRDIGTYVEMDYSCDESGAKTSKVVGVLKNIFGYASSVSSIDYNHDILASELKNNRPVILSGKHSKKKTGSWIFEKTTYGEGHAWVCDGFKETIYRTVHDYGTPYERIVSTPGGKFFHMNWGWSGIGNEADINNNGWFRYDNFEIREVFGNDGNNLNFQYKKQMIIGIKP
ncbi:C10 family peptidase [Myroides odoratus]|uniref:C10 family peptidase n=1 Tax=Myroides odoratus TaxID=256 RepID=A0A9Q6Z374_MYROD|nr:C10 family peptidase [Myroides odoratus]QQT99138.1 C10 family peptidase [Myroides odoratus]WQD58669.1 C10 family peptidase [Myroides odoratus]